MRNFQRVREHSLKGAKIGLGVMIIWNNTKDEEFITTLMLSNLIAVSYVFIHRSKTNIRRALKS